jgi:hypothetical protein
MGSPVLRPAIHSFVIFPSLLHMHNIPILLSPPPARRPVPPPSFALCFCGQDRHPSSSRQISSNQGAQDVPEYLICVWIVAVLYVMVRRNPAPQSDDRLEDGGNRYLHCMPPDLRNSYTR